MNCLKSLAVFALFVAALSAQAKDPVLRSVTINPLSVVGGSTATGTVRLSGVAPGQGLSVTIESGSVSAWVPQFVTVPGGSSVGQFVVSTSVVSTNTPALISASLGSITKTATLKVELAGVSSISFSPSSVVGGGISTGTVTLNGLAPKGGAVVILSPGSSHVSVPETVTVKGGSNSVSFTATTHVVTADTAVAIGARSGGLFKTALLTIQGPLLMNVTVSPEVII